MFCFFARNSCDSFIYRQTSDGESGDNLDDDEPKNQKYLFNPGQRHRFDSRNLSVEENDEEMDEDEYRLQDKSDLVNSKTINDILKYGAHQSADSNPIETQSEWSDDGDEDEAKGKSVLEKKCSKKC